ncbi:hypothetical protein [Ascidiimonas aurantiaca]|uniref:hypothetical protein n=1 Tax=Ascidiimonas aurantiaca TaxID=1685432 RepID=UPI0030EBF4B6
MRKILPLYLIFILIFTACRKHSSEPTANTETLVVVSDSVKVTLPTLIDIKGDANGYLNMWTQYKDFDTEMVRFYEEEEETEPLVDELIRLEQELGKSTFPDKFNVPQIKSRLLVLKTYLGKAKAAFPENDSLYEKQLKVEILKAYNALRKQFMEVCERNMTETLFVDDSL